LTARHASSGEATTFGFSHHGDTESTEECTEKEP
jgi:hypothetical protein